MRRIHSLTGVVPVGVFLVLHLWSNARALAGQDAYTRTKLAVASVPGMAVIEVALVLAPLVIHALYGLHLTFSKKARAAPSSLSPQARVVMRITGVAALAFIALHFWELRAQRYAGGLDTASLYGELAMTMSSSDAATGFAFRAAAYLLGVSATVIHFALGLWSFGADSFARSESARRRLGVATATLGAALLVLGTMTVLHFATGSRFGFSAEAPRPACPQPKER